MGRNGNFTNGTKREFLFVGRNGNFTNGTKREFLTVGRNGNSRCGAWVTFVVCSIWYRVSVPWWRTISEGPSENRIVSDSFAILITGPRIEVNRLPLEKSVLQKNLSSWESVCCSRTASSTNSSYSWFSRNIRGIWTSFLGMEGGDKGIKNRKWKNYPKFDQKLKKKTERVISMIKQNSMIKQW